MKSVSTAFLARLKLHKLPAYRIAQMAGVDPAMLSKLIHGITPVKIADERIIRVARVLGLRPEEAFTEEVNE